MNNQQFAIQIEALLFALGKPLSRTELARMLGAGVEEIEAGVTHLLDAAKRKERGIVLVDDGNTVELRTAAEAGELIERVRKADWSRDLGRAGAEVLAILLYRGPSTRAQIDFIRGVNSAQALRTLSMRGLVRKNESAGADNTSAKSRSIAYELTTEFLGSLGVARAHEAPEFAEIRARLQTLHDQQSSA